MKIVQWIIFIFFIGIFLVSFFYGDKKEASFSFKKEKPHLLPPQEIVLSQQIEIRRDKEKIKQLSVALGCSEEELTAFMKKRLTELQSTLPFKFSETFYNVCCIAEQRADAPFSYRTYQRLYLGETELGMPFYLDVRVFDLKCCSYEDVLAWHLQLLEGSHEEIATGTQQARCFVCQGKKHVDASHGFATQGERRLFLCFCQKDKTLYVWYAEAPLATFTQHAELLLSLPQNVLNFR